MSGSMPNAIDGSSRCTRSSTARDSHTRTLCPQKPFSGLKPSKFHLTPGQEQADYVVEREPSTGDPAYSRDGVPKEKLFGYAPLDTFSDSTGGNTWQVNDVYASTSTSMQTALWGNLKGSSAFNTNFSIAKVWNAQQASTVRSGTANSPLAKVSPNPSSGPGFSVNYERCK